MESLYHQLGKLAEALISGLHDIGLSWGWAIIAATFLVRLLISPAAYKQIRTMAIFRVMNSEVKKIRDYYGDNVGGMSTAMERLYKDNKFHPFNFVLPALIQAPVFASMFVFLNSAQFKIDVGTQQSFLFIDNITAPVNSNTLTFVGLVGIYMLIQVGMVFFNAHGKPGGRDLLIGLGLPAVISIFLAQFAAGVMLYWTAGMLALFIQQIVMRATVGEPEVVAWEPTAADEQAKIDYDKLMSEQADRDEQAAAAEDAAATTKPTTENL